MRALEPKPVGRDAEIAFAARFLEPEPGGTSALLLEGEPGIGKTTVWRAAVLAAAARGCLVLSSAPTEAESELPYSVLGDLLDGVPSAALAPLSSPLREALDVALFRQPAGETPTDQLAVSTAVYRVLREISGGVSVVVAVDDIQWADAPSRRVVAYALHRLSDEQVSLFAALRIPAQFDVAAEIRRAVPDNRFHLLQLRPLTKDAIDDLLLQRLNRPLRPMELEEIYTVSGGNPFFALEIGRFLVDNPQSIRAGEPLPVPRTLAEAIRDRIERLPPDTRQALVALACSTRPDDALLDRANIGALDAALDARVIERSQGRFRFTHPMLASVIYATAAPTLRRKWHSKLAEVANDPEERARHLALAASGPDAAVADSLEDAAKSANARGAPDAAAALAQQSAELTPSNFRGASDRRQIYAAEYLMRAGDVPAARRLLEAVLAAAPAGKRPADALRLMGSLTLGGDDLAGAERLLTEGLSRTVNEAAEAVIERDLIRILIQRGKIKEAFDHSSRLTDIASRVGDSTVIAFAERSHATTRRFYEPLSDEARATAIALAEDRISVPIDDATGGLHPLLEWAVLLKFTDDFEHARILFKRSLALTEGRDESLRAGALFHLAEIECWAGDWLLAAVYQHECEKSVMHTGHVTNARLSLNAKALLHCYRGEFDDGRAAANEALALSTRVGDVPYQLRALSTLGAIDLAAGDPSAAIRVFDRLRAVTHPGYGGVIRSEGDEVEAFIAAGRLDEAQTVQHRLSTFDYPWQQSVGARCRALMAAAEGNLDQAMSEFDNALRAHETLPMPLERARTLLGYGILLRRTRRKRDARERLEAALATFNTLGAAAWVRRAESELSRVSPAAAGAGELTPTETRVADLVAAGRTNKEVAADLSLSVKTVEANLSRIYDKLGVRSRSELAARVVAGRSTAPTR